jgi:tetratricopeptide (TPR) repeat protein
MNGHRMGGVILSALLAVFFLIPAARASDAVTEAKRRAASELMRDGKLAEAVALTQEVVKADPANYRDHLLLGRAYDKLNKSSEAVAAYRQVLELLGPNDDRSVRAEVERRLKVLDVNTGKIQAAEDEFLKKLDTLERDAIAAKDVTAVRRIFRLKAGVYKAADRRDRVGVEILQKDPWQETGIVLQGGRTYRVRAAGIFQVHPGVDCSPDGTTAYPQVSGAPLAMLIGKQAGTSTFVNLGSSGRFTADRTAMFYLMLNGAGTDKVGSSGSVTVLIEPE